MKEMTTLEKRYNVKERAEIEVKNHGSVDKAIKYLKAELNSYSDLWSEYSCDCLGHGITCTGLLIGWLEQNN